MFTIMAKNEVKYRPATMAEIENRDINLFMNGEQVWVLMIHRSEIIGEGEAKLDYIMLTNMKKVQPKDLQVIDDGEPANENENQNENQNQKEDKTMKPETLNINESGRSATQGDACQSKNVQNNAQVNNSMAIRTEADVTEAQDIMPVVTPSKKADGGSKTAEVKPTAPETCNLKPETTLKPAENTGRTKIVVARVPKPGESADKPKVKTNLKHETCKPETKPTGVLPVLTLAVYTTKRGEQAPRIDGFGGEEDPRWKKHYDEKIRLSNKREKAKRKNNKLYQEMKDKSAAEKEELLKKIIHVPSDPFGANYFIDHITGEKKYYFIMGAKYMDVAQLLVDAYNSGDEQAIAQAEQAVIDCKSGIVAEIEASRNADGDKVETLPETKVYTAAEVADLIQRIANSDPKALAEYDALTKKAA